MTHIEVTEEELERGEFPPICAKTGQPTTELVDVPLVLMPRWSRLLLLLGVVPWFIARPFVARRITARLPLSERLAARRTRSRADLAAALFGGFVAAVVGSFIPHDGLQVGLVGGGFLIVIGTVIALVMGELDYGVDLRPTAWGTVVLRRVHPRFRDALVRGDAPIDQPTVNEAIESAQTVSADPWA